MTERSEWKSSASEWVTDFGKPTVNTMKRVLILFAIGLLLPVARVAAQSVPGFMNFQGQLMSANGSPLATGDYELTFRVFDASEGGTLIWGPQVMDGAGSVGHGPKIPVVQGYFNVILGPQDTASRPLSGAFQGATRFLEIKVGTNNPIAPRQQILSAPYALNAASAASAASAAIVQSGGVNTSALVDGAVSTVKLNDSAVTSSKVADGSINASKLAQEVLDKLLPTGTIVAFGGATAPVGWALCDGATRNGGDATFSTLFAAIGKTYGIGDGTTVSFSLPDLRGRTAIGAGQGPGLTSRALAARLGIEANTQVPNHFHGVSITTSSSGAHSHTVDGWASTGGGLRRLDTFSDVAGTTTFPTSTAPNHNHTVVGNTTATGVPSVDNLQPSIVLNYIIKL
jgi:microcystin-dependent protein